MGNTVPSLIRTYVPVLIAALVGYLAEIGVVVPEDTSTALTAAIGGLAGAIYYALVRFAESRWPWVGALLGSVRQPVYPVHVPKPKRRHVAGGAPFEDYG